MIYDVAVIGAGVVGCAIFNKLVRLNKNVVLIEKNCDVCNVTSKANSGIIHAGFDAKPHSKKAILNVRGSKLMPKLCNELDVDLNVNGALVLGNDIEKIKDLYSRGIENGVDDLEILDKNQIKLMIRNIQDDITCGLFAKNSAIISPYKFAIALAEEGTINGGDVILNYHINSCEKLREFYNLSDGKKIIQAKNLVIACGGEHNKIAQILGSETFDIKYRRGEYILLDKNSINLKYTLFPLPDKNSKGILVSPTIHNNFFVGPTSILCDDDDTKVTENGIDLIKSMSNSMIKDVDLKKTIRVFSGVRSLVGDDFVIQKDKLKDNIINVTGICSPGLSASPAIAEEVCKLLGLDVSKEKKMIRRKEPINISNLNEEELNKLIKTDDRYGKIVCRCEMISEKEIIDAINSPLHPISLDAIKRRTRAGMGRCQGGFCFLKVMEIIAREKNMSIDEVTKENTDSRIIVGNIK